ncbi:hypothetical protein [Robertmurraya sp. FSL R5-0851]|uniref:hypothetical protein n=1 Tax=Robertmurraya sp. FSL R5-0851 TaxID=2921584 RepID=UPI0030F79F5A
MSYMMLNIELKKTKKGFSLKVSTNIFLLAPMIMLIGNVSLAPIIQILLQAYEIWGK